ncbi:MAG: hypothetical protein UR28_C0018G0008 [Candidatus Peregrinibacteria bacterium GW2011_GWF2_33_10]|nr:MAG: hypothetical protein UR28_C0018G0008 [Candidatus Peregrinibacteria bacterium GW2011_GWF2_33_10]
MSNEHLPDEQIPLDGSELLPADDILPESKFPLLNKMPEPPLEEDRRAVRKKAEDIL